MFKKIIAKVLMALVLASSTGLAQAVEARVIVPDAPGGAVFSGCYKVSTRMYGPYRMNFCLKQRGTYQVTGGGVTCNGRLDWSVRGRDITVKLHRVSCGNGVAWSSDTMVCRGAGLLGGIIGFVIIPDVPNLAALRCTYDPSAPNFPTTTILARRFS